MLIPSKAYKEYEHLCLLQLNSWKSKRKHGAINSPINLKVEYYMPTRHRVDLCNLLNATCDILVAGGVIEDDNCKIVASHDGSRVRYDKDNPRVEITISSIKGVE